MQPHGLQHTRPPSPSPTPRAYSNSCPLSWWCHPTISSSVSPLSSCPQSFPELGSSPVCQLFTLGGQSIEASTSALVLPLNIQDWFPLWLTGFISLLSKGLSEVFFSTTIRKYQFFSTQPSLWSNSYIRTWLLEKPQLWLDGPLSANWCLCFLICCNMHEIWPLWGVVAGIWTTLMYLNFFLDSLLKWALSLLPHLCFGSSGNQMIGNNDRGRNIISCW